MTIRFMGFILRALASTAFKLHGAPLPPPPNWYTIVPAIARLISLPMPHPDPELAGSAAVGGGSGIGSNVLFCFASV
eukprot:CAMPEP_0181228320 /NCGR_PEP_ID=MMETSP1096-20121128/33285_1 /TAXON_ID=156174 ORGANISM="Chrysochromulina ericina, Strain CCMP281" /NCGR_SAMPLE_ID=MMETSP1096 /ASSEMBLY_ACC=CAM_ASM_000453 /LENGTH=76 /DNA_ID=CAMNT_0023321837 /DNA_START=373 /DNA_END=603 /DNA_ORIENTATION=+